MDSKVDAERDHGNLAGEAAGDGISCRSAGRTGAERLTPWDLGAVKSMIWEHAINPCGRWLDMRGKPSSISVQMAPGDDLVSRNWTVGILVF